MQGRDRRHGRHGERNLDPAPRRQGTSTASRRLGSVILVGDERYSFSVVEESLTTETIAEYRRSRTPRTVPRRRGIRAILAAWLRLT